MKDILLSALTAVIAYRLAPDILNRQETIMFLFAVGFLTWISIQYIRNLITDIRQKRASLSIRAKRREKQAKIVNFPVRRRIIIPARKVMEGE